MSIRRVVPDIKSDHIDESRNFYADFLGFQVGMDMGWVITMMSPSNPTAQVTLFKGDDSVPVHPQMSIEVEDPRVGDAVVFTVETDATRPATRHTARKYLDKAQMLAGLPRIERGGWHAFRRAWATARKSLPLKDVMAAGGWRAAGALRTA